MLPCTHHAVLQPRKEVAVIQTVLDAFFWAVFSLELDHVSLEQPEVEAVLIATFMLPILKQIVSLYTDINLPDDLTLV